MVYSSAKLFDPISFDLTFNRITNNRDMTSIFGKGQQAAEKVRERLGPAAGELSGV